MGNVNNKGQAPRAGRKTDPQGGPKERSPTMDPHVASRVEPSHVKRRERVERAKQSHKQLDDES